MLFDDPDDDLMDDDTAPVAAVDDTLPEPREASFSIGHQDVERQLLALAASGKMPHALIFSGPAGIGKATMAFRTAKFLMSQKPVEESGPSLFGELEPVAAPTTLTVSAEEQGARLVTSSGHPDLLTLARKVDEKTGAMKESLDVEQIRSVGPFLNLTPFMGGWRMVIIDDADTMTRSSQNALLKVLEEPPANTLLILIAHRIGQLIPTIRSRSRVIEFSAPSFDDFSTLIKKGGAQSGEIEALYNISSGSIGTALRLTQSGALKAFEQVTSLLAPWPSVSWVDVHMMGEVLNAKGADDGLRGFQEVLLWTVEQIVKARAKGDGHLPAPLNTAPYPALLNAYSLEHWSKIWENLNSHFATVKSGSLDRRQAIFGAFSILKGAA